MGTGPQCRYLVGVRGVIPAQRTPGHAFEVVVTMVMKCLNPKATLNAKIQFLNACTTPIQSTPIIKMELLYGIPCL